MNSSKVPLNIPHRNSDGSLTNQCMVTRETYKKRSQTGRPVSQSGAIDSTWFSFSCHVTQSTCITFAIYRLIAINVLRIPAVNHGSKQPKMQRSREEERGVWELYHSNILAKSTFFSKLQTAALMILVIKYQ